MQILPAVRKEIIERSKAGESTRKIASSLKIPLSTTYYYARSDCKKQTRLSVEFLSSKEIGYLVGMIVGDGSLIRNVPRGEYLVKIALDAKRDRDVSDFVSGMFRRGGKKVTVGRDRGMIILRVWSKSLFEFLLRYMSLKRRLMSHYYEKRLVNPESWERSFVLGFIGGLTDSDGHVDKNARDHGGASITTSSPVLRGQLVKLFSENALKTTWRKSHPEDANPRFVVHIASKSFHDLCDEIVCVKHERFHGGPGRN